MAERKKHDRVVYYVGARAVGRVKIGVTTNLRARFDALSAQAIDKLEILATEPGSFSEENDRHRLFAHLRRHGEWFEWTAAVDDWIGIVRDLWAEITPELHEWADEDPRGYVFMSAVDVLSKSHAWALPFYFSASDAYRGRRGPLTAVMQQAAVAHLHSDPEDWLGAHRAAVDAMWEALGGNPYG